MYSIYSGYTNEIALPNPQLGIYTANRWTIRLQEQQPARHSTTGAPPRTRSRARVALPSTHAESSSQQVHGYMSNSSSSGLPPNVPYGTDDAVQLMGRHSVHGSRAGSSRSARHTYTLREAQEDLYYMGAALHEQNERMENLERQGEEQRQIAEETHEQVNSNAHMLSALIGYWNIDYTPPSQ